MLFLGNNVFVVVRFAIWYGELIVGILLNSSKRALGVLPSTQILPAGSVPSQPGHRGTLNPAGPYKGEYSSVFWNAQ